MAKPVWNLAVPAWARPAVEAMKALDALDAPANARAEQRHDGRFHGTDLQQLASAYVRRCHAHREGIVRLFRAAGGLMRYCDEDNAAARHAAARPIADALMEAADALIQGRAANFNAVPGLAQRYLPEELAALTTDIDRLQLSTGADPWKAFWRTFLGNCQHDVFKATGNSEGSAAPATCAFAEKWR